MKSDSASFELLSRVPIQLSTLILCLLFFFGSDSFRQNKLLRQIVTLLFFFGCNICGWVIYLFKLYFQIAFQCFMNLIIFKNFYIFKLLSIFIIFSLMWRGYLLIEGIYNGYKKNKISKFWDSSKKQGGRGGEINLSSFKINNKLEK